MKEKLYTIELMDAMKAGDECPFCFLERKLEQESIEFVLGSSYMESDIRAETDRQGFCRRHTKMMYDYGNALGNAWILKTRLLYLRESLQKQLNGFEPEKPSFFPVRKKTGGEGNRVTAMIREEESHCYLCARVNQTYERMVDTFVHLIRKEPEFETLWKQSRGCCIHHFADLFEACVSGLSEREKERWIPLLSEQMNRHLERVQEDIDWFIEKYDYANADADWKNSKDAVPRTMQKLTGIYPADPVFRKR